MTLLIFIRPVLIRPIQFDEVIKMANERQEEQKQQSEQLVHRLVKAIDEEPNKFNN